MVAPVHSSRKIAQKFAGYSLGSADIMRKAMGKLYRIKGGTAAVELRRPGAIRRLGGGVVQPTECGPGGMLVHRSAAWTLRQTSGGNAVRQRISCRTCAADCQPRSVHGGVGGRRIDDLRR